MLRLEVCAYFEPEVRAALDEEGIAGVELTTFRGGCDERPVPVPPAVEETSRISILRIGGHCMGVARSRHPLCEIDSCFDLLLGSAIVSRYFSQGAHLLTPSMLAAWRGHATALGLTAATAGAFFAESCTRMVLVDSGVVPLCAEELLAYSAFIGISVEVVPANLDILRVYLRRLIDTARLEETSNQTPPRCRQTKAS